MSGFTTDVGRVADALPDALAILEHDGLVSWVSRAAVERFAREPALWIGQRLSDLVHPDDRDDAAAAVGRPGDPARGPAPVVRVRSGGDGWHRSEIRSRHVGGGERGREFTVVLLQHPAS